MATAPARKVDTSQGAVRRAAAAVESAKTPFPTEPPNTGGDQIDLPGGLIIREQEITTATIRELNGAAEEALARAASGQAIHFLEVMLEHGVVALGDLSAEESHRNLKKLLVGDRESLLVGIRVATYGDEISVYNFVCPECGVVTDKITFSLVEDVKTVRLSSPKDVEFDVKLRNGRSAHVRLPNGEDQHAISENERLNAAERNTLLMQRCVYSIQDAEGKQRSVMAQPGLIRDMGIKDRHEIRKALDEKAPGPRYNKIEFDHVDCGKAVSLGIDLGDLFLLQD